MLTTVLCRSAQHLHFFSPSPLSVSSNLPHKRTFSAPDFESVSEAPTTPDQPTSAPAFRSQQDMMSEVAARSIHTPEDVNSPNGMTPNPSTPPTGTSTMVNNSRRPSNATSEGSTTENAEAFTFACSFVSDCTTGSTARKAVSHFFGRNKSCTLSIPETMWLYYCRKHYQRVRYRTGSEYAKTQINLVMDQLNKLLDWSQTSKASGTGPHIKDWAVTLRKRAREGLDDHSEGGGANGTGRPEDSVNGVPTWVIQSRGEGKSEQYIRDIVDRIRLELDNGIVEDIPEIEFLPNVVDTATGQPTKARKANKRKANKASGSRGTGGQPRKKSKVRQASSTTPLPTSTTGVIGHDPGSVTVSPHLPHPYSTSSGDRGYSQSPHGLAETSVNSHEPRGRAPAAGMPMSHAPDQSSAYPYYSHSQPATAPRRQWTPTNQEPGVEQSFGLQSTFQGHTPAQNAQYRSTKLPSHRDGEG